MLTTERGPGGRIFLPRNLARYSAGCLMEIAGLAPDRETTSFHIKKFLIKELDEAWYALLGDGIRLERVDFREAILRLGLDHLDELRAKYNLSPEEADA